MTDGTRSVTAMRERVMELNRMATAINEERDALEQQIADALALFKPGERVLYRGREYQISRVRPGYTLGKVRYIGRAILKSGALHQNERELWSDGEIRRVNA